jgi:phosphohistidine phosphatase SixA
MTYQASLSSGLVIIRGSRARETWERFRGGKGQRRSRAVDRHPPLPGADVTAKYGKAQKQSLSLFLPVSHRAYSSHFGASAVREKEERNADVGIGSLAWLQLVSRFNPFATENDP